MSTLADYNKKNMQKLVTFVLAKKRRNPSVQGKYYPPSYKVLAEEIVWDEDTQSQRVMKWIPGEKSIWADEHSEIGKTKPAQYIEFVSGFKMVSPREASLLEFMRRSERNKTNPNQQGSGKTVLYQEVEPAKTAQERMDEDLKKHKAKAAAYEMGVDDLVAYARVLGFNVDREVAEIRYDMVRVAEHDHVKFLAGLNNPKTKRKHKILEALDRGIIVHNKKSGEFSWGDTNMTIYKARVDEIPVDGFVEFTFNAAADGPAAYQRIERLLNPSSELLNEEVKKAEVKEPKIDDAVMSAEDLLELAISSEVIVLGGGSWYKFNDQYFNGKNIEQGKTKMILRLKADEELVETINTLLG